MNAGDAGVAPDPTPLCDTLLKGSGTPLRIGRQGRRPLQSRA